MSVTILEHLPNLCPDISSHAEEGTEEKKNHINVVNVICLSPTLAILRTCYRARKPRSPENKKKILSPPPRVAQSFLSLVFWKYQGEPQKHQGFSSPCGPLKNPGKKHKKIQKTKEFHSKKNTKETKQQRKEGQGGRRKHGQNTEEIQKRPKNCRFGVVFGVFVIFSVLFLFGVFLAVKFLGLLEFFFVFFFQGF